MESWNRVVTNMTFMECVTAMACMNPFDAIMTVMECWNHDCGYKASLSLKCESCGTYKHHCHGMCESCGYKHHCHRMCGCHVMCNVIHDFTSITVMECVHHVVTSITVVECAAAKQFVTVSHVFTSITVMEYVNYVVASMTATKCVSHVHKHHCHGICESCGYKHDCHEMCESCSQASLSWNV